jgi:hypothetical protein
MFGTGRRTLTDPFLCIHLSRFHSNQYISRMLIVLTKLFVKVNKAISNQNLEDWLKLQRMRRDQLVVERNNTQLKAQFGLTGHFPDDANVY